MLKKNFFILLFCLITMISCKAVKPELINGIDYRKAIIGKWEATELGLIMKQFKYELPFRLEFKENQDYYWLYTRMGIRNERWGDYELDLTKRPVEINLKQNKPLNATLKGIIKFKDTKTMHIIFYYTSMMGRVHEFKTNEIQVYKKVLKYTPQQ